MSTKKHYSKYNYKRNLIMYWRQFYPQYELPAGFVIHHIMPRSVAKQKGWDGYKINHPKNLIALHPDDHASIHKCRGDKYISDTFMLVAGFSNRGENNGMYGVVPWNKGLPMPKNISDALAEGAATWRDNGGMDEAYCNKISQTMTGVKKTDEHAKHIADAIKGEKHHSFNGYYHTPFGKLSASTQIEDKVPNQLVRRWCTNADKCVTIYSYTQNKFLQSLGDNVIGKTFREIGFWYEEIR